MTKQTEKRRSATLRAKSARRKAASTRTSRIEVTVPTGDQVLVEIVAEMLSAGGKKAEKARDALRPLVRMQRTGTGRDIVAMFRASPMVGVDLDFPRGSTVTKRNDR